MKVVGDNQKEFEKRLKYYLFTEDDLKNRKEAVLGLVDSYKLSTPAVVIPERWKQRYDEIIKSA